MSENERKWWAILQNKLIDYDYKIIYKPGRLNCNADALSRIEFEEDIPLINNYHNIKGKSDFTSKFTNISSTQELDK